MNTITRESLNRGNIDFSEITTGERIGNIHPGEILRDDFLKPMGISQYRLAKDSGISQMTASKIVRGKQAITAETALRLGRYFGLSPEFWAGLQTAYDLEAAELALADKLAHEVHPLAA
ncbi:MAG: HigA family addiction module antitoxin [Mariprofundaceae bacterium]|nr:HigA family addiction module antitoxin [Mariprofundaceae bacterium]